MRRCQTFVVGYFWLQGGIFFGILLCQESNSIARSRLSDPSCPPLDSESLQSLTVRHNSLVVVGNVVDVSWKNTLRLFKQLQSHVPMTLSSHLFYWIILRFDVQLLANGTRNVLFVNGKLDSDFSTYCVHFTRFICILIKFRFYFSVPKGFDFCMRTLANCLKTFGKKKWASAPKKIEDKTMTLVEFFKSGTYKDLERIKKYWGHPKKRSLAHYIHILASFDVHLYALSSFVMRMGHVFIS